MTEGSGALVPPRGVGGEFWLGSRTESSATDFDGRPRRCRALGSARTRRGDEVLLADAEPPLPGQERGGALTLRLHRPSDAWEDMAGRWLEVHVGLAGPRTRARLLGAGSGVLDAAEVTPVGWGEVAAALELLPPTGEQLWEASFAALERFVAREGHARVPEDHREGDLGLGVWVANQRVKRRHGYLSTAEIARLEALPAWQW